MNARVARVFFEGGRKKKEGLRRTMDGHSLPDVYLTMTLVVARGGRVRAPFFWYVLLVKFGTKLPNVAERWVAVMFRHFRVFEGARQGCREITRPLHPKADPPSWDVAFLISTPGEVRGGAIYENLETLSPFPLWRTASILRKPAVHTVSEVGGCIGKGIPCRAKFNIRNGQGNCVTKAQAPHRSWRRWRC